MWKSKDDIVKDLASLNDFGVPGDQEPYQFLYSFGRGLKTRQKKISEQFLDSRTGEIIDVTDLDVPDTLHESKGRGTLLGNFSKSTLQKQLRLARPLGSSDEAVESYYGRHRSAEKTKTQTNPVDPEFENKNHNTTTEYLRPDSSTVETRQRVKAVRNSNLQCNALIANLLSKAKANSDADSLSNDCSSSKSDSDVGFSIDVNINMFNKIEKQKSLINDFKSQDASTFSIKNENCLRKQCDSKDNSTEEKNVNVEYFESIYGGRKEDKIQEKESKSKSNSKNETCFDDDTGNKELLNEQYVKPEQKLNRLDENNSKVNEETNYKFALEMETRNEFGTFNNSIAKSFLYSESDFPPLRRN